jgi:hypothetical protein
LPLLVTLTLRAQDDGAFDRTPQDCISVSSIDQTDAIDDQNLIFRMRRRDQVFRNHLPRRCPGLERENRIAYQARGGRLCSIDTITVLEQFGVGFRDGFTCRLGEFVPMSPEEVEELELRERGRETQDAVEARSVELDEDDDADGDDADADADHEAADDGASADDEDEDE